MTTTTETPTFVFDLADNTVSDAGDLTRSEIDRIESLTAVRLIGTLTVADDLPTDWDPVATFGDRILVTSDRHSGAPIIAGDTVELWEFA